MYLLKFSLEYLKSKYIYLDFFPPPFFKCFGEFSAKLETVFEPVILLLANNSTGELMSYFRMLNIPIACFLSLFAQSKWIENLSDNHSGNIISFGKDIKTIKAQQKVFLFCFFVCVVFFGSRRILSNMKGMWINLFFSVLV